MWQQVIPFNQSKAGKKKGWCLQNNRLGYGIASKYPTAWQAWLHTQQHKNRSFPKGVTVPLYYSYGTDGHINQLLTNGTVWSDGTIYKSIDDYLSKHPSVHFVGWGESINGVRVIKQVADPRPKMPKVGSRIQLIPRDTRTTFKAGTTTVRGHIKVTDNSFVYFVRGYDSKYPGRIIINTASGGGNGVALALYYTNGQRIAGWKQL